MKVLPPRVREHSNQGLTFFDAMQASLAPYTTSIADRYETAQCRCRSPRCRLRIFRGEIRLVPRPQVRHSIAASSPDPPRDRMDLRSSSSISASSRAPLPRIVSDPEKSIYSLKECLFGIVRPMAASEPYHGSLLL